MSGVGALCVLCTGRQCSPHRPPPPQPPPASAVLVLTPFSVFSAGVGIGPGPDFDAFSPVDYGSTYDGGGHDDDGFGACLERDSASMGDPASAAAPNPGSRAPVPTAKLSNAPVTVSVPAAANASVDAAVRVAAWRQLDPSTAQLCAAFGITLDNLDTGDDLSSLSSSSEDSSEEELPRAAYPKCSACLQLHPPLGGRSGAGACPFFTYQPTCVAFACHAVVPDYGALPDWRDYHRCKVCQGRHVRGDGPKDSCPVLLFARHFSAQLEEVLKKCKHWRPLDLDAPLESSPGGEHVLALASAGVNVRHEGLSTDTDYTWLVLQCLVASRGLACAIAAVNDGWARLVEQDQREGGEARRAARLGAQGWARVHLAQLCWRGVMEVWSVSSPSVVQAGRDGDKPVGIRVGAFAAVVLDPDTPGDASAVVARASPTARLLCQLSGLDLDNASFQPWSLPSLHGFVPDGVRELDAVFGECWWIVQRTFCCSTRHSREGFKVGKYEATLYGALLDVHVDVSTLAKLSKASLLRSITDMVGKESYPCPWCKPKKAEVTAVRVVSPPPTVVFQVAQPRSSEPASPLSISEQFTFDAMHYRFVSALFCGGLRSAVIRHVGSGGGFQVLLYWDQTGMRMASPSVTVVPTLSSALAALDRAEAKLVPKVAVYEALMESRLKHPSVLPLKPGFQPQYWGGCGNRNLAIALRPCLVADSRPLQWQRQWSGCEARAIEKVSGDVGRDCKLGSFFRRCW
jgi:hypothetical protein